MSSPSPAPALVGVHEAAELLGISKSAIAERRRAGTFPEPVVELRCGPIWRRSQIERHAKTYRPGAGGYWARGEFRGRPLPRYFRERARTSRSRP